MKKLIFTTCLFILLGGISFMATAQSVEQATSASSNIQAQKVNPIKAAYEQATNKLMEENEYISLLETNPQNLEMWKNIYADLKSTNKSEYTKELNALILGMESKLN